MESHEQSEPGGTTIFSVVATEVNGRWLRLNGRVAHALLERLDLPLSGEMTAAELGDRCRQYVKVTPRKQKDTSREQALALAALTLTTDGMIQWEAMATKSYYYKYKLRQPLGDIKLLLDQVQLGHRYYNQRIELARKYRAAIRSLVEPYVSQETEVAQRAYAVLEEITLKAKLFRAETKSKKLPEDLRLAYEAARKEFFATLGPLAKARRAAQKELSPQLKVLHQERKAEERELRTKRECYQGTGGMIETAVAVAEEDTPLWKGFSGRDPIFRRWEGEGRVGVQVQGGCMVTELTDTNTLVQLTEPRSIPTKREGSPPLIRRVLRLRIESNAKREPIWAEWPVDYHRDLPVNAHVKQVAVHKKRLGSRSEWWVLFSLEEPVAREQVAVGTGTVAFNLGWRQLDNDLRVAYWMDDQGKQGELRVPLHLRERHARISELQQVRDRHFNQVRKDLAEWMQACPVLPKWLVDDTKNMADWQSPKHLAVLAWKWKDNRFDDDSPGYSLVEAWRRLNKRLWNGEAFERQRFLDARTNLYRETAHKFGRTYRVCVFDTFNIASVAKKEELSEEDRQAAAYNRTVAGASYLRRFMKESVAKNYGTNHTADAAWITKTHVRCGTVLDFDAAPDVMVYCPVCKESFDQDRNACQNLLQRWREGSGAPKSPGTARKPKKLSRQEKFRMGKERIKQLADAEDSEE